MNSHRIDRAVIERVAENTQLREGPVGVAEFLRVTLQSEPVPLNLIAQRLRLPLPVTTALRRELEREGVLERSGGVALTESGRAFVEDTLGFSAIPAAYCAACRGSGLAPAPDDLVSRLAELLNEAPPTRVELDQAPCTPETALRRVALMHDAGLLHGRRLLLVGDDDSVSIAIWLYLKAQNPSPAAPSQVVVVELDEGRAAFLETLAMRVGMPLNVVRHDLRKRLPDELHEQFDAFQTDPPYTIEGARLFVGRALEALKGPGAKGYVSFGHQAPRHQRQVLGALHDLGFAVTRIHPDFNAYQGASIIGARSQLLELDLAEVCDHGLGEIVEGPLYTADYSTRERVYVCKNCGHKQTLGAPGAPATIEALKNAGCSACGGRVFRRAGAGRRDHHPKPASGERRPS